MLLVVTQFMLWFDTSKRDDFSFSKKIWIISAAGVKFQNEKNEYEMIENGKNENMNLTQY